MVKLLVESMGILALAGVTVLDETDEHQSKPLGAYLFRLTKRWNEENPARWPQSLSRRRRTNNSASALFCAERRAAIIAPGRQLTAGENASTTRDTSFTTENVVYTWFECSLARSCVLLWTNKRAQTTPSPLRKDRSGRLPETALSITSFQ